jgi:hypothetical protein
MVMTVIVPTRGRPDNILSLLFDFYATKHHQETRIIVAVDDDDPKLDEYKKINLGPQGLWYQGPRKKMGPTLNDVAIKCAEGLHRNTDIIGFMGDDHRPRTPGWDLIISNALWLQPGVGYGDDLHQGRNLPTAVFINSRIVRALGYFHPPSLIHLYLDNFWLQLGRYTQLHYFSNVIIEHMHPNAGKAANDAGYVEVNSQAMYNHDRVEFERYMREDWPTEKLRIQYYGSTIVPTRDDPGVRDR